ncbi:PhpK family radical SAM P-methyltransferase [Desulfobacterales bacterium HSG2]|nr:PhpK family radical SAM P-methyltransferase [Desulfobacterales bacterium HSG2]
MTDCLIIGHNDIPFSEYEKAVRKMGSKSGAYRDVDLNFIRIDQKPYSFTDVVNIVLENESDDNDFYPCGIGEVLHPAIAYLGTYLSKRGHRFDYINDFRRQKENLAEKLKSNVRAVAITTTYYVSVLPVIEIVGFIREHNDKAVIILGGPLVSTQIRNEEPGTVNFFFDTIGADIYVNSSQGEASLAKIINALKDNSSLEQIPNIYYKKGSAYSATHSEVENNRLAENMTDWSLFYGNLGQFASLRTAISCPFSCAFCGFPEHAGEYQTVSAQLIEKELDAIAEAGTVKSVCFTDDTFNVPPKRFKSILEILIKNNYDFSWNSNFRCQFADDETVAMMKESKCEGVFLGIESGSQQILDNMNKNVEKKLYEKGIRLLNKYGILSHANFIIGFPGETEETIAESFHFIEESETTFFRAQLWYCEPITPIWRQREKYGIKGSHFEWKHYSMNAAFASDIIDDFFINVKNSVWLQQYNLDFFGLCRLMHRGKEPGQLIKMMQTFNNLVKDKISGERDKDVSIEGLKKLDDVFFNKTEPETLAPAAENSPLEAGFDL